MPEDQLQSYITQLQAVKDASKGIFDQDAVLNYAVAIEGLESKQAALLLSTQGLTNAQIAETLAVNEATTAETYQAMADAGLLKSKQQLTIAEIQENLQTVLGADADTSATMASLGLSAAIEGQEHQILELTAKKLQEAVATHALTEAQAQELAMRTGVMLSMNVQTTSIMPTWIATMKAMTVAIWNQVKATAAWLILNPKKLIITAIAAAAVGATVAIYKSSKAVEECKDRVDELMSSYKSSLDEANNNAKTIEDLISRYNELSKGVDNLGRTFGLTTDEVNEYHEICNQIADISPSLVQGWTNQGNAIISLKDNIEELTNAYKEAQQEAYNTLILGKDDILKNVDNLSLIGLNESSVIAKRNELNNLLNMNYDEFRLNGSIYSEEIRDAIGIDTYDLFSITEDEYRIIRSNAKALVCTYQNEIDSALSGLHELANAYLMTNEDYAQLDDSMKNAASIIVNSFDENMAMHFASKYSDEDICKYVNEIVDIIKDNPDVQDALVGLFTLDTSEMSPEDAKKQVDTYIQRIADVLNRDMFELKVELGFDDVDQIASNYSNLINDVAKKISGATDGEIINERGNYEKYQEIYNAIDEFANEYSINTQDELAYFQDALEEANYDIDKAFELYLSKIQDSFDNTATSTISDSVYQIAKQLRPQFDELADAYNSIFTEDGMNLEIIDNDMLESLRSSFADIEEELGVTFDASLLNDFFDVLTDGTSTVEDVHDAFNDLATAYFYSTDTLEHLNEATAESIKQQLEQMGVVNNEEIINHYLTLANAEEEIIDIQNQLAEAQKDLAEASNTGEYESAKGRIDLTYRQIEAYYNEKGATEELRIALFNLQLQQANLNINSIDSSSSVSELLKLAEAAGLSAEYIEKLVYLQELFNRYQSATNSNMQSAIYAQIQSVESGLETPQLELEVDFPSGKDSGAGDAGKDAADEYMDAFNDKFDRLKFLRDNGIITEKEYLDQLRILYEKYFKDKEEYLKEYVEYERQYLNGLKDLYEDVLGGITDLLDDQIDKIEEERDTKIDALEEEQEARKKALEQQKEQLDLQIDEIESQIKGKNVAIDTINDEIDAIKEANDERQRQIDLQKALYDLERMQNQRTILQYSEDKGMHYVSDTSGIRDAKQNVDDAKREIEIANKEKQISLIEDEISLLESRKTLLEDQQADLDKQIDSLDEYYNKLIENTKAYYSALIKPIEDYKAQFENIAEIEESAIFVEQLESLGYSINNILSLNISTLENYKSNYLGILRDMYDDNTQMIDAISQVSGLEGEFVGYLSQSQPYIDSLARLDLSSTQTAIDSANSGIHSFADGAVMATVNMTTMADTITSVLNGSKKKAGVINSLETMASALLDANNQIEEITSGLDALDGRTVTVKVNIETSGNASLLSNAHADGTNSLKSLNSDPQYGKAFAKGTGKYKGLPHDEKNALVSEYGQTEMIVLPNGKTIITDEPTMMDLPKDTVIFNEEQTKKIISNKVDANGNAHADGTDCNWWIGLDGHRYRDLQPGDRAYELQKAFEPFIDKILKGEMDIVSNAVFEGQKQMERWMKEITNNTAISNVTNNRNVQPIVNQTITVNCPNVTNNSGIEYIQKEFGNISLMAIQAPLKDY